MRKFEITYRIGLGLGFPKRKTGDEIREEIEQSPLEWLRETENKLNLHVSIVDIVPICTLFLFLFLSVSACNASAPVDGACEEIGMVEMALDECLDDLQKPEIAVTAEPVETAENRIADTDWQFLAETCEQELLSIRANSEIISNQYDGLSVRSNEALDALLTLPQESVDYACSRGIWKQWLCDYLNYTAN